MNCEPTPRTCEVEACTKPHRAKGMCVTHYNRQMPNKYIKAEYTCRICLKVVVKDKGREKRYTYTYCSYECMGKGHALVSAQLVKYTPRPALHAFIDRLQPPPPRRAPRSFVAGTCRICSRPFADLYGSVTCSDACQAAARLDRKREAKHRRRALKRDAFISPVNRRATYERDDWTCQLCGDLTDRTASVPDPLAPTLDHIIALANGGTHEPANVQTAHFMCNVRKGDRDWTFIRAQG